MLAARIPDMPQIVAFRNPLIHGYATVKPEAEWTIVQNALPALLAAVQKLLDELTWLWWGARPPKVAQLFGVAPTTRVASLGCRWLRGLAVWATPDPNTVSADVNLYVIDSKE